MPRKQKSAFGQQARRTDLQEALIALLQDVDDSRAQYSQTKASHDYTRAASLTQVTWPSGWPRVEVI